MRKEAAFIAVLGSSDGARRPRPRPRLSPSGRSTRAPARSPATRAATPTTASSARRPTPTRPTRLDPRPRRRQRPGVQRLVLRDGPRHRAARAASTSPSTPGSGAPARPAAGATCSPRARSPATAAPTASTRAGAAAWPSTSRAQRSTRSRLRSRPRSCGTAPGTTHRLLRRRPRAAVDRRLARSARGRRRPWRSPTRTAAADLHRHLPRLVRPGLHGAIDDVSVWDDRPPAATGPVIAPVPGTPTHIAIPGCRSGGAGRPGTTSQPQGCLRVTLSRRPSRCAARRG